MPIVIKIILSKLASVVGKMLIDYFTDEDHLEGLVKYGAEKLVKSTKVKWDDQLLSHIKEKTGG